MTVIVRFNRPSADEVKLAVSGEQPLSSMDTLTDASCQPSVNGSQKRRLEEAGLKDNADDGDNALGTLVGKKKMKTAEDDVATKETAVEVEDVKVNGHHNAAV